jgi:hypothetical protein
LDELNWSVPQAVEKSGTLPGEKWSYYSGAPSQPGLRHIMTPPEETVPTPFGIGLAAKKTGLLERYGFAPGMEGQTETLKKYSPSIEVATNAAEKLIRDWLSLKGYPQGVIKGVIASLAGAGALASFADELSAEMVDA